MLSSRRSFAFTDRRTELADQLLHGLHVSCAPIMVLTLHTISGNCRIRLSALQLSCFSSAHCPHPGSPFLAAQGHVARAARRPPRRALRGVLLASVRSSTCLRIAKKHTKMLAHRHSRRSLYRRYFQFLGPGTRKTDYQPVKGLSLVLEQLERMEYVQRQTLKALEALQSK